MTKKLELEYSKKYDLNVIVKFEPTAENADCLPGNEKICNFCADSISNVFYDYDMHIGICRSCALIAKRALEEIENVKKCEDEEGFHYVATTTYQKNNYSFFIRDVYVDEV